MTRQQVPNYEVDVQLIRPLDVRFMPEVYLNLDQLQPRRTVIRKAFNSKEVEGPPKVNDRDMH
jgi:hypothetical protein